MAEATVDSQVPAKLGADASKKPLLGLTFLENLADMPVLRQVGLLVGLAASIAIGFGMVLWSQQPDYKPLYGSLNGVDANKVVEALGAADIAYNTNPVVPGKGSAIFLHVSTGGGTAGCVSLAESNLLEVLRWLDPAAHPVIVMGPSATIRQY